MTFFGKYSASVLNNQQNQQQNLNQNQAQGCLLWVSTSRMNT